ncbi:transmembrane protein 179B [Tiliqua scincoides]|uniref:transmembrane protein 179B n=1 Tax=Tiliqua scincoides TaxID=71010 RepID=UPI003462436E
MARPSALLLLELAVQAAAFLCGVISASALTVTQGKFGGHCILYGAVLYNGTLSFSSTSHVSTCYFVSAISMLAAVLSFSALLYGIYSCCVGEGQSERMWLKGSLALSGSVLFFLLISACILRVGMDALCSSILKAVAAISCQEAQHRSWVRPYDAKKFYDNLYTAEAAAWVNFFFWCLILLLLVRECVGGVPSQPLWGSGSARTNETTPILGDGRPEP